MGVLPPSGDVTVPCVVEHPAQPHSPTAFRVCPRLFQWVCDCWPDVQRRPWLDAALDALLGAAVAWGPLGGRDPFRCGSLRQCRATPSMATHAGMARYTMLSMACNRFEKARTECKYKLCWPPKRDPVMPVYCSCYVCVTRASLFGGSRLHQAAPFRWPRWHFCWSFTHSLRHGAGFPPKDKFNFWSSGAPFQISGSSRIPNGTASFPLLSLSSSTSQGLVALPCSRFPPSQRFSSCLETVGSGRVGTMSVLQVLLPSPAQPREGGGAMAGMKPPPPPRY